MKAMGKQLDDGLTEEIRDLLKTLPSENGWLGSHIYQYQGFWYGSSHLQGLLNFQKHFETQNSDILLSTYPKTGTTWLKALTFSLVNRTRYPDPDQNHPLMSKNPHDIVPYVDMMLYANNQMPDLSILGSPRIISTHLSFHPFLRAVKDSACRIVYLSRNPKDTLVSLWHFTNKQREINGGISLSLEEAFNRFCRGVYLYGPYWDHVLEYWKESLERPHMIMFLKYEEIKSEPQTNLKKLAKFLGYPFSEEEKGNSSVEFFLKLCSFENLSGMEVNCSGKLEIGLDNNLFFRRGEVGDYINCLSPEMIQHLDQLTREKFDPYGLHF
ncbi:hypothetical protein ACFE04_031975 [Oxalis oulophora]